MLLGLRVAPKEDSGVSSAELVYGARLNIPEQFLLDEEVPDDKMAAYMKEFSPLPLPARKLTGPATASTVPDHLMTARYVYVRRGGQGIYIRVSLVPSFVFLFIRILYSK